MTWGRQLLFLIFIILATHVLASENEKDAADRVIERFWTWRLRISPPLAISVGVHQAASKVENYTEDVLSVRHTEAKELLADVKGIATEKLERQLRLSILLLKNILETYIDGYPYRSYAYNPFNILENPIEDWQEIHTLMQITNKTDYDNLMIRYRKLPQQYEDWKTLMRIMMSQDLKPHNASFVGVLEVFGEELEKTAEDSVFFEPLQRMPDSISAQDRDSLSAEFRTIIEEVIQPEIRGMIDFLEQEILPNTRPLAGLSSLPGGLDNYKQALKWYLSTDHTPEEIHQMGLKEVERISKNIEQIKKEDNFTGTLLEYLRSFEDKPEFYFQTQDELMEALNSYQDEILEKIAPIFKDMPLDRYEIRKKTNCQSSYGSYSGPSRDGSTPPTFWINACNPKARPKFQYLALTLHEGAPGHHLQDAYRRRLELAEFRVTLEYRKYFAVPLHWQVFTSFSEGWALYAESLGEEIGIYKTRYYLLGRYLSEIFRAGRLVVDTGIHAFGWEAEDAIEYLSNYSAFSPDAIEREVNRYIGVPGQACSYKIGELKIRELRKYAEDKLGDDFDLKEFHYQVLTLGTVPLSLLDSEIKDWVAMQQQQLNTAPSLENIRLASVHSCSLIAVIIVILVNLFIH